MKWKALLSTIGFSTIFWTHIVIAGEAAPFIKEVGAKINKTFIESERELKQNVDKEQRAYFDSNPSEAIRFQLDWYRKVYIKAGYDYDATIRAVARRLQSSQEPHREIENKDLAHTPFQNVLESLWLITGGGPDYYSSNFDGETLAAVNYIYKTIIKDMKL